MQSGEHILGIAGMTPGGVGIWALVILALIGGSYRLGVKWVGGMPDRKRAENEAIPAASTANEAIMTRMVAEMERMGKRIEKLELRVDELEESERGLIGERDAALAENARLRAIHQGQGEARAHAAAIVAVDRLEAQGRGVAR
jgi:hypothetical protein